MRTDVRWSAFVEGALEPFAKDQLTIVCDGWAEMPGYAPSVVNEICIDYFRREQWREFFGEDEWWGDIEMEVHSPAHIAGRWHVSLELKVDATAERVDA